MERSDKDNAFITSAIVLAEHFSGLYKQGVVGVTFVLGKKEVHLNESRFLSLFDDGVISQRECKTFPWMISKDVAGITFFAIAATQQELQTKEPQEIVA